MITVVVPPDAFAGPEVELSGFKYRHLFRARRLARGDEIRMVDGVGSARIGVVAEVSRDRARLASGATCSSNEPSCRLDLLAPIPKPSRLAWLIEKATEVGVYSIRLMTMERAPRKMGRATLERLGRIAEAAVEQSHRAVVPAITGPHSWSTIPDLTATALERRFLIPTAKDRLTGASGLRAALLVGPEGGYSSDETGDLENWGWHAARLGETVLRIETAAIVGSATLLI